MSPSPDQQYMFSKISQFTTPAILLLFTLAGCNSHQIDQRLVGEWQIAEPESLNQKVSGEERDELPLQPSMKIEFSRTGELTTTTRMGKIDSVKTGSWKVLSPPSESESIQIKCQLAMQKTEHEIEFDKDTIRWIPPNMAGTKQKILFIRLRD